MEDQASSSADAGGGSAAATKVRRRRVRKSRRGDRPGRTSKPGWWTAWDAARIAGVLGFLIEGLLIAMLVLAPLPLGSVAPWARGLLFLSACLLLCLWAVRSSLLGRLEIVRTPLWIFVIAYLIILCAQLIPLPHILLSGLSPKAAELYAWLVPGYPDQSGPMSVTMNPHATVREIFRVLAFAIVLFVFVNHFRDRRPVARVLWALVAIGLFQAFYGLAERFSGSPQIFWITPRDTLSVHGTYYNRNHFAGLMEMLAPAVFGFFLASLAARGRSSWRSSRGFCRRTLFQRIEEALSKGGGYRNVLLGMVVAAMFLAGMLSLSRGGTAGLLVGFLILFVFTLPGEQKGGRTVRVFVLVLLVALGLLFYRGVQGIVDRFEQLAEEDSSWAGRKELREAGARMLADFPLLGVGGGAFRYVFPAYQPDRYGDRAARYLHNDWLQVACETGVVGAAVAYTGISVFLLTLLRAVRRRRDPYCRLIFAGAFAGVAAMLLHSLVDFNLYMVTANGLIFTVLMGVCHTAVHMEGRSKGSRETLPLKVIELRGKGLRFGLPFIVSVLCLAGSILPVRSGLADIAFNRYRVWAGGRPDTYFFWGPCLSGRAEAAGPALARALELEPNSAEYNFSQGARQVGLIREKILSAARARARALLSDESSAAVDKGTVQAMARDISRAIEQEDEPFPDEGSEEFQALVSALTEPARRRMQEEIRADLEVAEHYYRKAMRIAPTVPWYRMSLAMAYADLLGPGPELEAERTRADAWVEEALVLAPGRPASLFSGGRYYARRILDEAGGLETGRQRDREVLAMFEKALRVEPAAYAHPTYEFLSDEGGVDPEVLFRISPDTLAAHRRLQGFFSKRRMWSQALRATEKVLVLQGIDPLKPEIPEIRPDSPEFRSCLGTTAQQLRLLQRLGMHEPWRVALERYRSLLRVRCAGLVEQASRYARLGRLVEAGKACTDCLEQDWYNLDAFLALTEARLLPGAFPIKGGASVVLPDLLRLLHAHPSPDRAACDRLTRILARLSPETPVEHLGARLVEAIRLNGCGDPEEAARILRALILVDARPFVYWHQRHLLYYHLGRALETSGSPGEAVPAYGKALELAPAHRPSLERLVALGGGEASVPVGPGKEPREEGQGPSRPGQMQDGAAQPEGLVPERASDALSAHESSPGMEQAGEAQESRRVEDESPTPSEFDIEVEVATRPPSLRERLLDLTPERPWGIDLAGQVSLLGITLEGAAEESQAEEAAGPYGLRSGFTARYLWEVSDDLDPRDYEVLYRYLDADEGLVHSVRKTLFSEPERFGKTLDGGIGTVLVHWDYLPVPPETAREVRILVRQRPKGKTAAPPLKSVSGDAWTILGLTRQ